MQIIIIIIIILELRHLKLLKNILIRYLSEKSSTEPSQKETCLINGKISQFLVNANFTKMCLLGDVCN